VSPPSRPIATRPALLGSPYEARPGHLELHLPDRAPWNPTSMALTRTAPWMPPPADSLSRASRRQRARMRIVGAAVRAAGRADHWSTGGGVPCCCRTGDSRWSGTLLVRRGCHCARCGNNFATPGRTARHSRALCAPYAPRGVRRGVVECAPASRGRVPVKTSRLAAEHPPHTARRFPAFWADSGSTDRAAEHPVAPHDSKFRTPVGPGQWG
jgi:hypothetical protein